MILDINGIRVALHGWLFDSIWITWTKVETLVSTSYISERCERCERWSPISPLLFLLYLSKLPKLVPNTRRSLFADDSMIYAESSIADSHLLQSNLQTSLDKLTVFNADHRIILSCTKSVRVLFERRKSKKLKPQDVTYNGQVIPASTSVKFLGITFKSHYHTIANIARHRLLKLNSIFTSTYGPSTSTLIRLYKSYIRSLFDYGAPATCVAPPPPPPCTTYMGGGTNTLHNASTLHSMLHPQRQKTAARLPSTNPWQKPVLS